MSENVQFEEDNFSYKTVKKPSAGEENNISTGYGRPQYPNLEARGMSGWLVRHGIAKSNNIASFILAGIVVINIIITYLVIKYFL